MIYKAAKKYNIGSSLFKQLVAARGLNVPDDFLEPSVSNEYHYLQLHNMDKALNLTEHAVNAGWKILVVLDVDVDGIMSGAMVYKYLTEATPKYSDFIVDWTIGTGKAHGLEQYDKEYLKKYDLIIACDSLSNEFELYEELASDSVDIILLDHHDCGQKSPYAITVNSEMLDYPNSALSGAGVCYKFLQGLDDRFGISHADDYVEMACIGIIADVMDMTSMENRSICSRGFQQLNNYGLKQMVGVYKFCSSSISFGVAPIINACQRDGKNEVAARIVLGEDKKAIRDYLTSAEQIKAQQKTEVSNEFEISRLQIENDPHNAYCISFASNRNLTGLVATKVSDFYQKPAIVLYTNENKDYFTGSIRSCTIKNFKDIINNTGLAKCDGHQESAGIYIAKENMAIFKAALAEALKEVPINNVRLVDFEIDLNDINPFMLFELEKIDKITGNKFKRVSFLIKGVAPPNIGKIKDRHTTFTLGNVTFFNWNNTDMYDKIVNNKCWGFDLVGNLEMSNFRGKKTINFIIEDFVSLDEIDI